MKPAALIVTALVATSCASLHGTLGEKRNPYAAEFTHDCGTFTSVHKGSYCVETKGQPLETYVLFHGAGDSEFWLQKSNFDQKELWNIFHQLNNIRVVSIAFGEMKDSPLLDYLKIKGMKIWLLSPYTPKEMAETDATVQNFEKRMLPELEAHLKTRLAKPFKMIGHSMGGLNAATLVMSYPEMFSKVVLSNAMIPDPGNCDLYSNEIVNESCWPDEIISREFPKKQWPKVDPLERAKTVTAMPPTLVLATPEDDFNLFEGPKKFAAALETKGLPVEFVQTTGGHFDWAESKILEFLKAP